MMTGLIFTLRRPSLTMAITGPARGGAPGEDELVVQPGRTGWNDLRAGSGVDCKVRPNGYCRYDGSAPCLRAPIMQRMDGETARTQVGRDLW